MAYDLSKAKGKAAVYRYSVVQANTTSVSDEVPAGVLGWTDHATRRCYVFLDRIANLPAATRYRVARKIAMHEVGHVRWRARRLSLVPQGITMVDYWRFARGDDLGSSQQVEEDYCETYSRLKDPQTGVSYSWRDPTPTGATLSGLASAL